MPFAVTVRFQIKPGQMEAFLSHMRVNAASSVRDEPGCRQFDICTDPAQPDTVFLYEIYDDEAAFETHQTMPHFAATGAAVGDLVADRQLITFASVTPHSG